MTETGPRGQAKNYGRGNRGVTEGSDHAEYRGASAAFQSGPAIPGEFDHAAQAESSPGSIRFELIWFGVSGWGDSFERKIALTDAPQ